MSSIWDPETGQTYSFDGLDGRTREEILAEMRKRNSTEALSEDPPGIWDQFKTGVGDALENNPITNAVGPVLDKVANQQIPFHKERADFATEHPNLSRTIDPGGTALIEGAAGLIGASQQAIPAMQESWKPGIEPRGTMEKIGDALGAGYDSIASEEGLENIAGSQAENRRTVTGMPTVLDAVSIGATPWTMGASGMSRIGSGIGKVGRVADAMDAMAGVQDIAQGNPIQGGIRVLGGSAGAFMPGAKMVDDVPSLGNMDELAELTSEAEKVGINDTQIARMTELEGRMPDETVQPVNAEVPPIRQAEEVFLDPEGRPYNPEDAPDPDDLAVRDLIDDAKQAEEGVVLPPGAQRIIDNRNVVDTTATEVLGPGRQLEAGSDTPQDIEFQRLDAELSQMDPETPEYAAKIGEREAYAAKQARAREAADLQLKQVREPESFTPEDDLRLRQILDEATAERRAAAEAEFAADEAAAEADEIADEIVRQEDDANAAAYEAEKADVIQEAGDTTRANAAEAGKEESFRDWIARKYPNGMPKKGRRQLGQAYREFKERGFVEDIPPGELPPGNIPKGKKPLKPYTPLTETQKFFGRTLANIKKSVPEAGKMLDAFRETRDTGKAAAIHDLRVIKDRIRKAGMDEDAIIRYLDGEEVQLPLEELKAAMELRRGTRQMATLAKAEDVLIGERAAYFPHYTSKARRQAIKIGDLKEPSAVPHAPHLEMARKSDGDNWIRNLDVLENYYSSSWDRTAAARHLGKRNEKLSRAIAKYGGVDVDKTYLKEAIRAIVKGPSKSAKPFAQARYLSAVLDLPLAGLYQIGQISATAGVGGVRRTMKQTFKLLADSKFRKATSSAAERSGATLPDIAMEMAGNLSDGANRGNLYGIGHMDKQQRIVAYAVGETILSEAQAGNKGALKTLEGLGFTEDVRTLSPDTVGKRLSDKTQFRTGPAEKPLWASNNEVGKFAYQYKHFAYQWGIMVRDLIKERNFGALSKMMVVAGVATGEIVGDVRAAIKGYDPFMDEELDKISDGDPAEYLKALTTRSRRYPLSHPIHRVLQNWGMAGGFGLLTETMIESFMRPGEVSNVGGILPASRRPLQVGETAVNSMKTGDVEPLMREGIRQIPAVGYSAWTKSLTSKPRESSGRRQRRPSRRRRR